MSHGGQEARVGGTAGEEREAAVAGVFEEKILVGQAAGHKLVGLAVPGLGESVGTRRRVSVSAAEVLLGRVDGSSDWSARGGGFAGRVGEGWRRGLVGIQLRGGGCGSRAERNGGRVSGGLGQRLMTVRQRWRAGGRRGWGQGGRGRGRGERIGRQVGKWRA